MSRTVGFIQKLVEEKESVSDSGKTKSEGTLLFYLQPNRSTSRARNTRASASRRGRGRAYGRGN